MSSIFPCANQLYNFFTITSNRRIPLNIWYLVIFFSARALSPATEVKEWEEASDFYFTKVLDDGWWWRVPDLWSGKGHLYPNCLHTYQKNPKKKKHLDHCSNMESNIITFTIIRLLIRIMITIASFVCSYGLKLTVLKDRETGPGAENNTQQENLRETKLKIVRYFFKNRFHSRKPFKNDRLH